MKIRATITLDPEIHRRAKRIARKRHTTVSGLIESLLAKEGDESSADLVNSMLGIAKLRESEPGADPLFDRLKEKYLHS